MAEEFVPKWIAWETTQKCNLKCVHCYTDSANREYEGELTTREGFALIVTPRDLEFVGRPKSLTGLGDYRGDPSASRAARRRALAEATLDDGWPRYISCLPIDAAAGVPTWRKGVRNAG